MLKTTRTSQEFSFDVISCLCTGIMQDIITKLYYLSAQQHFSCKLHISWAYHIMSFHVTFEINICHRDIIRPELQIVSEMLHDNSCIYINFINLNLFIFSSTGLETIETCNFIQYNTTAPCCAYVHIKLAVSTLLCRWYEGIHNQKGSCSKFRKW